MAMIHGTGTMEPSFRLYVAGYFYLNFG